jgi:hypothetical protein
MTKEEYLQFHKQTCEKMVAIAQAKNADYTGTDLNPFANFSKVEVLGICAVEQGFLTRMTDKFMRIISFQQKGFHEVKEESVEDTLIDLANYCILLAGYLRHKREATKNIPPTSTGRIVFEGKDLFFNTRNRVCDF